MSLGHGTRLGPYEIAGPLGAGGMGEVYRAHDTRLGRDVAIKVLPAEFANDPDRLRRFEQEARAASVLDHPNILAVHDVGSASLPFRGTGEKSRGAGEVVHYLVTELLEGESLRERLRNGALPVCKAVELAVHVASGLAAAHEKGIVHRDLKPENLFVTRDGRVKVLDFGLAKQFLPQATGAQTELRTQDMAHGTETGVLLGTVGYMSPEQVRGEPADSRSDIFSFGCVLFEMLSGQKAFQRETAVETLNAILKEDPPALVYPSGSIPSNLGRIVRRCLEKRPENRFASAPDLHFALQSLLQAPALEPAAKEPAEKSIVVLPFENLSPDPDNAYFADGLAEEIIADLAKVRALRVISRTSAMLLRGSKKDVPTIARELRVRYVLEGSVRRAGQSLRITAQLIDAAADTHLWAEKYTGTVEDVFDMQEKVSRAIVEALRLELTPQEHQRMAERPIPNLYAYECYLKARREILRFVRPSLDKAMEYLEQGLRAMPDNPLLLAGMGYVHFQRVNMGFAQEDSLWKAEDFATRALELAPDLAQGHLVLGLMACWHRGMIKTAIAHFEQVLATDPNDLDVLRWSSMFYAHVGRLAQAASIGERVIAIDPMSPTGYLPLVFTHWLGGHFDLALGLWEQACKVDPGNAVCEVTGVFFLIPMGRHEEAFALAERAEKEEPLTIIHRLALLLRYAFVGERAKALSWMTPEALQTCRRDFSFSLNVACAYVMLDDVDTALDWLENAIERGFLNHRYLGDIDPILAPLRGDHRFQALLARAKERQAEFETRR
jgi:serine/threonine protein kinase/Tfp pilus assembly protein PilF